MSVGAAVVGTGFGCLTHVRALRAAGFEVHALVGRDPDKTTARAERFEIPHAFTSLAEALAILGERQRGVIVHRYGLNGFEPQTLDEIGRRLGVSRERVRQLEAEALKRLAGLPETESVRG